MMPKGTPSDARCTQDGSPNPVLFGKKCTLKYCFHRSPSCPSIIIPRGVTYSTTVHKHHLLQLATPAHHYTSYSTPVQYTTYTVGNPMIPKGYIVRVIIISYFISRLEKKKFFSGITWYLATHTPVPVHVDGTFPSVCNQYSY